MAKYLDKQTIEDLEQYRQQIFTLRKQIYEKYQIDVLDNDTLSSVSIYKIVSQYDLNYNTNFSRNGEDAKSLDILIEQKCSNVKPNSKGQIKDAAFQFHAMGNLEYDRYILVVRNKVELQPVRMYDIEKEENTNIIKEYLLIERSKWLAKGQLDPVKNMKRDVITLPESLLKNFKFSLIKNINNCQVFKD